MAKQEPKQEPKEVPADSNAEKVKYNASIKLRAEFKKQLEEVAEDLGIYPGELIETRLGQFIRAEYKRVLKEKLKSFEDC